MFYLSMLSMVKAQFHTRSFITGSIACSASRQYLINSEVDFEVFAPQGQHAAPMGVKFSMEEGTPHPCQISPRSVQRQGCRTPKTEIFTQI